MNWDQLERDVRAEVKPTRWPHVAGVVEMARTLARRYGADEERAALAALVHDVARDWPAERLRASLQEAALGVDALERSTGELLHAPVSAWWAYRHAGVGDGEVLAAVRYHTTGRPRPGLLEMILMVADFSEPGRGFSEAEEIRRAAERRLEDAVRLTLQRKLSWLLHQGLPIHPRTVAAHNWWLSGGRAGGTGAWAAVR